jgi:hypothetical protein
LHLCTFTFASAPSTVLQVDDKRAAAKAEANKACDELLREVEVQRELALAVRARLPASVCRFVCFVCFV